jgi:hypothetical protein
LPPTGAPLPLESRKEIIFFLFAPSPEFFPCALSFIVWEDQITRALASGMAVLVLLEGPVSRKRVCFCFLKERKKCASLFFVIENENSLTCTFFKKNEK